MIIYTSLITFGVVAVAALGGWFTNQGLYWYYQSQIPPSAPPGWVISLAWTVIYFLCAVSLWLWFRRVERRRPFYQVVWLFVLNGTLNWLWCALFFGQHWTLVALCEIVLLEATVVLLVLWMWRPMRLAALLLLPYAAWVAYATYINWDFWRLNG